MFFGASVWLRDPNSCKGFTFRYCLFKWSTWQWNEIQKVRQNHFHVNFILKWQTIEVPKKSQPIHKEAILLLDLNLQHFFPLENIDIVCQWMRQQTLVSVILVLMLSHKTIMQAIMLSTSPLVPPLLLLELLTVRSSDADIYGVGVVAVIAKGVFVFCDYKKISSPSWNKEKFNKEQKQSIKQTKIWIML